MGQTKKQKKSSSKSKPGKGTNFTWLLVGGALVIMIAIGAVLLGQRNNQAVEVSQASLPREISVDEAASKRQAGAFILDVRQPEEWQEYHIPGSTLIPLDQLEARVNEVPRDQEVVVVCRSGNRSQAGRDILLNAKFQQVTSMAGGLKEWQTAGYETVSGP